MTNLSYEVYDKEYEMSIDMDDIVDADIIDYMIDKDLMLDVGLYMICESSVVCDEMLYVLVESYAEKEPKAFVEHVREYICSRRTRREEFIEWYRGRYNG